MYILSVKLFLVKKLKQKFDFSKTNRQRQRMLIINYMLFKRVNNYYRCYNNTFIIDVKNINNVIDFHRNMTKL